MDFNCRVLNDNDYSDTLVKWWNEWGWAASPPKSMLPEGGTGGIMVSKGDIDICAGFIFFTNSKTAWVEYIISNSKYKDSDRSKAIEFLINGLTMIAKDNGYKHIFTSLNNENLIKKYIKCGYIAADKGCTQMVKNL